MGIGALLEQSHVDNQGLDFTLESESGDGGIEWLVFAFAIGFFAGVFC